MDTERDRPGKKFPLWKYLNQPLFDPKFKSLNPLRFWHLYHTEQLEACWTQHISEPDWVENPAQFLEICWLKTDMGIEMVRNLYVIQFLEGCWNKELSQSQNASTDWHNVSPKYLDDPGEY